MLVIVVLAPTEVRTLLLPMVTLPPFKVVAPALTIFVFVSSALLMLNEGVPLDSTPDWKVLLLPSASAPEADMVTVVWELMFMLLPIVIGTFRFGPATPVMENDFAVSAVPDCCSTVAPNGSKPPAPSLCVRVNDSATVGKMLALAAAAVAFAWYSVLIGKLPN